MAETGTPSRQSVLIVDDRPDNLFVLEHILEPLGVDIVKAASGQDALRELLERDFAVIILDVRMPRMDGFETAAMIRLRDRTKETPIIFVTGVVTEDASVFKGYSVGAVDYMFKPIVPHILRSKVAVFIELHRKSKLLERQEQELKMLRGPTQ